MASSDVTNEEPHHPRIAPKGISEGITEGISEHSLLKGITKKALQVLCLQGFKKWAAPGSNWRPLPCEDSALTN